MPLAAATREELKSLYNALNDRVLEPGDPVYVAQVNQGSTDAVAEIATEIDWQDGGGVCLFTGQRGTGKSTELKRLKQQLESAGAVVFYTDLSEYLLLTKEVEISDFLVSIAGAMSEQVLQRYQASPGNIGYWDRFKAFLNSKVELKEFTLKLEVVDIKASLKADPDFKRKVQEAARGYVAQLIQEAHGFLAECVDFVRKQEGQADLKVVLLVDSVERIRGVGSEAMAVYESVRNLFFGHAESLRIPMLHVVYTIPPYLSVLAAGAGTLMGGAVARRLVSTHIFKDRCREGDPEGLAILRKVVTTRYPAWERIFSREALEKLGMSSGGDLREFFRLVRLCLPAVRDDAQLPLDTEAVKPAENAARNEMLPIPAEHLTWLQRITKTHETCLEKDADLPTLAHFLDNRLVLNYRNGSDWYDVHPLLREVVDNHAPTGA
ncbi:MAG: ATP-binding protein [Acidobacteria bacterium]|nr:ATP-binding protein [Acidobacteriota bacterium]MBI3488901.1 ATP-binding protein [Acidobacteriota bacterium]